jgi:lysophospholipase L1-like esterase
MTTQDEGGWKMKRGALLVFCALVMTSAAVGSALGAGNASAASTAAKSVKLNKGSLYVSVGSSLASGFGIAPQSPPPCGRSGRDYGQLVGAKLRLKLVDVSCGGAVIPDVLTTSQGTAPPQIDLVTAATKLITIGLGGNDIDYNGTAFSCSITPSACQAPANLAALEAALPGQINTMIAALKTKAPSATIVVVTYPREFPTTNCPALGLTDADVTLLGAMGAYVERALAAAAHKTHVLLVDPYSQPGNHTACGPAGERWTNGSKVATGAGFPFHPTVLGHQQMAKMILKVLGH